jgi:hypothetical protein
MRLITRFALTQREKPQNREFFSNFSKPERFLRGLSLIAEHSRIPRNVFGKNPRDIQCG